jgi:hypothetical protein
MFFRSVPCSGVHVIVDHIDPIIVCRICTETCIICVYICACAYLKVCLCMCVRVYLYVCMHADGVCTASTFQKCSKTSSSVK